MVRGLTFDNQTILAKNDRSVYNAVGGDYRLKGAECSGSGNSITVSDGYVSACGGIVQIDGATTISVTPAYSNGYGRLIVEINLGASSLNAIASIKEDYTQSSSGEFDALTQEDINASGSIYQIELCRFPISSSSAGVVTTTLPLITEHRDFNEASINYAEILGSILPGASNVNVGTDSMRFYRGAFQLMNISSNMTVGGVINANGGINIPKPTLQTMSLSTNWNSTSGYGHCFEVAGGVFVTVHAVRTSTPSSNNNGELICRLPSALVNDKAKTSTTIRYNATVYNGNTEIKGRVRYVASDTGAFQIEISTDSSVKATDVEFVAFIPYGTVGA